MSVAKMSPAQAQRESYKLARSVEHLKNTQHQLMVMKKLLF